MRIYCRWNEEQRRATGAMPRQRVELKRSIVSEGAVFPPGITERQTEIFGTLSL